MTSIRRSVPYLSLALLCLSAAAGPKPKPAWVATVTPLLGQYKGFMPMDFLLGWIAVESGGRNDEITKLDERGYFQIHPSESKDLNIDHKRLTTDPAYSVQSGIKLVTHYVERAKSEGFNENQDFFWRIVKLNHAMGAGSVSKLIRDMRAHHAEPSDWAAISSYARTNKERLLKLLGHDPEKWIRNVDEVMSRGRELAS